MTNSGGANGYGTVLKITPSGTLTTLCNFCSQNGCTDGDNSNGALVEDADGKFYGVTYGGGANTVGTVFSLSVGLGPFVKTLPTSGKVGAAIKILGTNLTGTTSVSFNGTAAVFKVVSSSFIATTVPAGATTGTVQVVTPGGTLSSNVPFRVTPTISNFSPTSGTVGTSVVITGNSLTGRYERNLRGRQGDELHGGFLYADHRHRPHGSEDGQDRRHHAGRHRRERRDFYGHLTQRLRPAHGLTSTPTWTQLGPFSTSPFARSGHSAVYNLSRNAMVVFGRQHRS